MKKASKRVFKKDDVGKELCQKYHCMKRIKQRLKVVLTEDEYNQIVSVIKNNKEHPRFKAKYLLNQSKRLSLYELKIDDCVPVNVIYDKFRKTIVTVLFPIDGIPIYYFYDIFNNKINIKDDYGFGNPWRLLPDKLEIAGEEVETKDGYFEVVSDGILKGKKFKFEYDELCEFM